MAKTSNSKSKTKPKYVSDFIDFKKDILDHRIICIRAGVGSGKNTWVRKLVDLDYTSGIEYGVLYITSRKAVANTEAERLGAVRTIKIEDFEDPKGFGELDFDRVKVYATNSTIEKFMSETYLKNVKKPEAHIWNKLDFVVIDECHSLTTDATFSSAPYYVDRFIRLAYEENPKLRFIFMTGTIDPIKWFFYDLKDKGIDFHYIKLYDKCVCVKPNDIALCQQDYGQEKIKEYLRDGKKVVYFVRKISDMANFWKTLQDEKILTRDSIGVGFSKDEKISDFTGSEAYIKKSKKELENYIKTEERLPDNIKLFLSTSQNKEGVNLQNDDIDYMFVESTLKNEIIQMAGRARKGIKRLYIIYDTDFTNEYAIFEKERDENLIEKFNGMLDEYDKSNDSTYRRYLIEDVEKKYPNIRHDPFLKESKNHFVLYTGRINGNIDRNSNQFWLNEIVNCWDKPMTGLPPDEFMLGSDYFENYWFPGVNTELCPRLTKKEKGEILKENRTKADKEIKETLRSNGWFRKKILDSDKDTQNAIIDIVHEINAKYKTGRSDKHSTIGKALATCGLQWQANGGKDPKKTKELSHIIREKE